MQDQHFQVAMLQQARQPPATAEMPLPGMLRPAMWPARKTPAALLSMMAGAMPVFVFVK
jgi:hypothetical protein